MENMKKTKTAEQNSAVVKNLEPKAVFKFFAELSSIPRGSGNTSGAADYLSGFAERRGLEFCRDASNNVIIIKEASAGAENAESVILQGHTDMVCEKTADCTKDMTKEGLDLAVDGDFIYAEETTLGADDGIAVALILAILDDDGLIHPRIEAVFTSDEEIGMDGAAALDTSRLRGKRMINLDSEEEGVFTAGCAGGMNVTCRIPIKRRDFSGVTMKITVKGLTGGHSGTEIDKGRANADKLMGRIVRRICDKCEVRLVSVDGGLKNNAIPCFAEGIVCAENAMTVKEVCGEISAELKEEFKETDGGVCITAEKTESHRTPMDCGSTARIAEILVRMPDGVIKMSSDAEGMVETSLNLGIMRTEDDAVELVSCVRSSIDASKRAVGAEIERLADEFGGEYEASGDYPGWEYRKNSPLRETLCRIFEENNGRMPKIEIIHAGLECGIFSGKIDGLDCVSCGPRIDDIHTVREKMSVSSVGRLWRMITEALEEMSE